MSTRRLVLQNSALNFVTGISQRMGQTLIFILVARLLTAEDAGSFKLANTYSSILLTLSLWGLDQLFIREVSKNRGTAKRHLSNFLVLRVLLAVFAWVCMAFLLPLFPYTPESRYLILIMTASIVPASLSNIYQAVWVSFEDMKAFSVVMFFYSFVRLAGGIGVLWQGSSLIPIAYFFLLVSIAELFTNAWLTHRHPDLRPFSWRMDFGFWLENLKIAVPLTVVSFILVVEYQFDDVILSLFRPVNEVGVYGTAATILTMMLFLSRSFQLAIFPVISRAFYFGQDKLQTVYSQSMKSLLLISFPLALGISLFGTPIITTVFGPEYAEAGPILSVLIWAFFISAVNVPNSRLLIVANKQRMMALFALLSMTGNIIISLLLVPRFGGLGTAWARVLAMPLYTIPALVYVHKNICPIEWRQFWRLDLRAIFGRR